MVAIYLCLHLRKRLYGALAKPEGTTAGVVPSLRQVTAVEEISIDLQLSALCLREQTHDSFRW